MSDLHARLFGATQTRRDEKPKVHPIDRRAQAMELHDRFKRAQVVTRLSPGIVCQEKRGMTSLNLAPLLMFWRWLNPTDSQDVVLIDQAATQRASDRIDCLVGLIGTDGELLLIPAESWRLEPCSEFDADAEPEP